MYIRLVSSFAHIFLWGLSAGQRNNLGLVDLEVSPTYSGLAFHACLSILLFNDTLPAQ